MLRIAREVRVAADLFEQLPLDQLLAEDDRVDRAVLLVELEQHVEDDLVVGLEERLAVDDLHDLADHLLVEHHRREQAHLRLDRVRRQAVELAGDGRVDRAGSSAALLPWRREHAYGNNRRTNRQADRGASVAICLTANAVGARRRHGAPRSPRVIHSAGCAKNSHRRDAEPQSNRSRACVCVLCVSAVERLTSLFALGVRLVGVGGSACGLGVRRRWRPCCRRRGRPRP